jgi:hypothetical protein
MAIIEEMPSRRIKANKNLPKRAKKDKKKIWKAYQTSWLSTVWMRSFGLIALMKQHYCFSIGLCYFLYHSDSSIISSNCSTIS